MTLIITHLIDFYQLTYIDSESVKVVGCLAMNKVAGRRTQQLQWYSVPHPDEQSFPKTHLHAIMSSCNDDPFTLKTTKANFLHASSFLTFKFHLLSKKTRKDSKHGC